MTLDDLLARLDNPRRTGKGWQANCPACGDRKGHLSVGEGDDGRILIHCFHGCQPQDILSVLGLGVPDLFTGPRRNGHSQAPQVGRATLPPKDPLSWLRDYCGVTEEFIRSLPLHADGSTIVFEFEGSSVWKFRRAGERSFWWEPVGGLQPPLWPCPEDTLPSTVYLAESETDAIVARSLGLPAYALTHGAGTALLHHQAVELARRGAQRVALVLDADDPGRKGAAKQVDHLVGAGLEVVNIDLVSAGIVDPMSGGKDIRDAWLALRDPKVMLERLAATISTPQPNLQPIGGSVGGQVCREMCAADLKARPNPDIRYLDFLGQPGYIPEGWATLIAAYPKCGKTELVARLCSEWTEESVLYVTEEPESIWAARLSRLPGDWRHMRVLFALGMEPEDVLARMKGGTETVVVIDTVRNLLGLRDETDNSEVARALTPFVEAARDGHKTLLLLHHVRKGGGDYGEGITGGHAFLGIVDVALELLRETNLGENKRRIRGWGRLFPISDAVYELRDDGSMNLLGSPKAVELGAVKERVLEVLSDDWARTREVLDELSDPKPSLEQVRLALNALVAGGSVERDPMVEKRGVTYRYRVPKVNLQRTPPMVGSPLGGSASPPAPTPDANTVYHEEDGRALRDGDCRTAGVLMRGMAADEALSMHGGRGDLPERAGNPHLHQQHLQEGDTRVLLVAPHADRREPEVYDGEVPEGEELN
jgi:hypothetical protein